MRPLFALLLVTTLTGCSNLNVSWQFTASYNLGLQAQTLILHVPKEEPAPPAPLPIPPIPPGKPL